MGGQRGPLDTPYQGSTELVPIQHPVHACRGDCVLGSGRGLAGVSREGAVGRYHRGQSDLAVVEPCPYLRFFHGENKGLAVFHPSPVTPQRRQAVEADKQVEIPPRTKGQWVLLM